MHRLGRDFSGVFLASEMARADVLAANAQGIIVLLAGQATIEQAFLRRLMLDMQDEFRCQSDWVVKVKCSQTDDCHALTVV